MRPAASTHNSQRATTFTMAHQLNIGQLQQLIGGTLTPDRNVSKAAEQQLQEAQRIPGYPLIVLQLVAANTTDVAVRQAAAVNFKNLVKKAWDEHHEDGNDGIAISLDDRNTIKSHLVQLMCTVPPMIQSQLSETISLIAAVDYPQQWTNLMPELVQQFNLTQPTILVGVLKTANSILKRFRYVTRSDELYTVIAYTLQNIQAPLLALFKALGQAVAAATQNDTQQLTTHMEALRLVCRIFYSLNYQDLPEFFEDHMKEWMDDFANYLTYHNAALVDTSEEDDPSPIDKLQVAIIKNVDLYADKDEEAFLVYLPQFTTLIWNLLLTTTAYPKHDELVTTSIRFLSGLVQKIMHKSLFAAPETLRQIVLNIVIPNLMFRESDEERFKGDPRDYMMTEIEGSDSESRRKCSQDLLRSMNRHFETETTQICQEHVGNMLAEYAKDPIGKWAAKDAAINLVMGVAIRKESASGVAELNNAVNIMEFFQTQIFPELQDMEHMRVPVVKATSIKFVSTFRNQFSREQHGLILPVLINHLGSPIVVVHTFAAYAIERILFTKEDVDGRKQPKIGGPELQPALQPLFKGLFALIDKSDANENDYVMKCVMRALVTLGPDVAPVTQVVIEKLTAALARVAKNPHNPQFNHCLFESIAVLIRSMCSNNPSATGSFEQLLFDPFTTILRMDIGEFTPYVIQILAQLLEYRPVGSGLGQSYSSLFEPILTPVLWEQKGNLPALTRLMQAYIKKAPADLIQYINQILGVFQKLLSVRSTETYAFDVLTSAVFYLPAEHMEPKIPTVFQILLVRLQASTTAPRYKRLISNFFALYVAKHSPKVYMDRLDAIQVGLGVTLLEQVWLPRLQTDPPSQHLEAKAQVVALSKLLCDYPPLLADSKGQQIWMVGIAATIRILTSDLFKTRAQEGEEESEALEIEYDSKFSLLKYASKPAEDYIPEHIDPVRLFVHSLHRLVSPQPGQLAPQLKANLEPQLFSGLETMFQNAGLQLV
ncbi:hypothetical protein MPSEU_000573500 [Mayamaea pseudoterrestris]|nr:hypothetical protein MPSEU_000573500 [Mayamaea pseudoterrestris]